MSQNRELELIKRAIADLGDRVESMSHELTQPEDEVTDFIRAARARLTDLTSQTKRVAEQTKQEVSKTAQKADALAHENPWMIAGIAAGVGLVLGLILNNRK